MIFCLLSFTIAFANPIDQQDALAKAKAFVQERGINMSLNGRHTIKAPSSNGEDDNVGYYIFNSANDQGFVIVSGYDCIYPILGYSDKGHIDTDNMPDALKAMLDDYAFKGDSIYLAAGKGIGLTALLDLIGQALTKGHRTMDLLLPYSEGGLLRELTEAGIIQEGPDYTGEGVRIRVLAGPRYMDVLAPFEI